MKKLLLLTLLATTIICGKATTTYASTDIITEDKKYQPDLEELKYLKDLEYGFKEDAYNEYKESVHKYKRVLKLHNKYEKQQIKAKKEYKRHNTKDNRAKYNKARRLHHKYNVFVKYARFDKNEAYANYKSAKQDYINTVRMLRQYKLEYRLHKECLKVKYLDGTHINFFKDEYSQFTADEKQTVFTNIFNSLCSDNDITLIFDDVDNVNINVLNEERTQLEVHLNKSILEANTLSYRDLGLFTSYCSMPKRWRQMCLY